MYNGGLADSRPAPSARRRLASAGVILAVYLLVTLAIPRPENVKPEGWRLLGIFAATIAGLILQPVPGGALVLAAVTLAALAGGLTVAQALGGYGDPTVWLVLAAFFISDALIRTGLARRIALFFVRGFGRSSLGITYALSSTDLVLGAIIPSNGARSGGVVLPIARSIAELYGSHPGATSRRLGAFLIVAVYQSICVTAAMLYTGQASNPLIAQIATDTLKFPVTMTSWALAGIVPGLCSLLIVPWLIYRFDPPEVTRTPEAAAFARAELDKMGPLSRDEKIVSVVFLGVCIAWVTTPWHRADITTTGLAGSVALLLTGVLKWEDVIGNRAAWDIFIWYGGMLRLGRALGEAGIPTAFAQGVAATMGDVPWPVLLAVALLVNFYAHYGFASITAHVLAMFVPFAVVLIAAHAPPGLVVFSFATFTNFASGLTNYGTTPSPMFYGQGYVSFREWWRTGFLISLVNLAIWSTIGFAWWKAIGVW